MHRSCSDLIRQASVVLRRSLRWPLTLACCLSLAACTASAPSGEGHGSEEDPELATLMADLQRHTDKLGYSLNGRNRPLAAFYLEELSEAMERVQAVGEHEGLPIGSTADVIMTPLMHKMYGVLNVENPDWLQAGKEYEALIGACNRCHTATEHQFIKVLPAQGEPPYNQRFTVGD